MSSTVAIMSDNKNPTVLIASSGYCTPPSPHKINLLHEAAHVAANSYSTLPRIRRSSKTFKSKTLFILSYQASPISLFWGFKEEKHVLFPSVADDVIKQEYLQSLFGGYSLRIENVSPGRPPNDDVQILRVANPIAFKKVFSQLLSATEDVPCLGLSQSPAAWAIHDGTIHFKSSALCLPISSSLNFSFSKLIPQSVDLALLEKLEVVGKLNQEKTTHKTTLQSTG